MPMVQMNTRIDQDLKQRGDAVLAKAGFTPSEAVRALWELAAAHEHEPKTVAKILSIENLYEKKERRRQIEKRREALEESNRIMRDFYQEHGITREIQEEVANIPDKELYEMELLERYKERGLL